MRQYKEAGPTLDDQLFVANVWFWVIIAIMIFLNMGAITMSIVWTVRVPSFWPLVVLGNFLMLCFLVIALFLKRALKRDAAAKKSSADIRA